MQPLLMLLPRADGLALEDADHDCATGTGVPPVGFRSRCDVRDHQVVVTLEGEIDLASRDEAWSAIARALARRGQLVIDLAGVSFCDSTGLQLILRATRERRPGSPPVVVRSPRTPVHRLLRIARLDELVAIEEPELGSAAD